MNRRKAREYALQMLFQSEFAGKEKRGAYPEDLMPSAKEKDGTKKFVEELITGTIRNIEEIDKVIQAAADNWDLNRMAAVDRNILRLAIFEILYRDDIPSAVTINEALEIAKKYSSLESVPFINGLLDKIARSSASCLALSVLNCFRTHLRNTISSCRYFDQEWIAEFSFPLLLFTWKNSYY